MKKHSTYIGNLGFGKNYPIRIQSMTNTDTAEIEETVAQILELANAGSELVRITVDSPESCMAVPEIVRQIRKISDVPIVGDFHFNGHIFLEQYPEMAQALDKYRINPGNVGNKKFHDKNFEIILSVAKKYNKIIRIGVNGGSLDSEVLTKEMDLKENKGKSSDEIFVMAMVKSALESAIYAEKFGIPKQNIVLSVKHSNVPMMISAYRKLSSECDYLLHVGLTEAGGGNAGIINSSIALGTLLQEGIGDTIRVSITPQKGEKRTKEVKICQEILQSLEIRNFSPKVISCPGCGRTAGNNFTDIAEQISQELEEKSSKWTKKYSGFSSLHIAVMGCIVNGLGEAANADIGIFFPGKGEGEGEGKNAVLMIEGKQKNISANSSNELKQIFFEEVEKFLKRSSR